MTDIPYGPFNDLPLSIDYLETGRTTHDSTCLFANINGSDTHNTMDTG